MRSDESTMSEPEVHFNPLFLHWRVMILLTILAIDL